MAKKILIGFGAFILLLVIAAVSIPFFVKIDNYRPEIVKLVNDRINGKFELGKLDLTLWGTIKVQVDGFSLSDGQGRKVISAKDVYAHIPWSSIFQMAPRLTLRILRPEIEVLKDKTGKMNVLTLMKPKEGEVAKTNTPPAAIPAFLFNAKLGLDIKEARLKYQDLVTQLTTELKDLYFVIKDLSLNKPTQISLGASLDTQFSTLLKVQGPFQGETTLTPTFKDGKFSHIEGKTDWDFSKWIINEQKISAKFSSPFRASQTDFSASPFKFTVMNAVITGAVSASGFGSDKMGYEAKVESGTIDLKGWNFLSPLLKEYELAGNAQFAADVKGEGSVLNYKADAKMMQVTAKAPMLKSTPQIDGEVKVSTDKLDSMWVTMKAKGGDMKFSGSLTSFTHPVGNFQLQSEGLDLDQMIELPKLQKQTAQSAPEKSSAPAAGGGGGEGKKGSAPATADFDAMLDPLRKNPIAAASQINANVGIKFIKVYDIRMTNINSQMSFKDLAFNIQKFGMGLWDGTISANGSLQAKPKMPTYRFSTQVNSMDLKKAVTSQVELFKNTLYGNANFKMDLTGASLNPDRAKTNLDAKGSMKVEKATFAAIDVARMASVALNQTIGDIGNKIPAMKGKTVQLPGNYASEYEFVSSDFTISKGTFNSPNFYAKSLPNKGLDLKGATQVGIIDYALKANWEVIDTHNFLKARDLSIEQMGVRVDHVLADGDKPVSFPIIVGGTLFKPEPNYSAVPEALTKVALKNASKGVQAKAKSEAKKLIDTQAKKYLEQAPAPAQDAIKDFSKKLFGN